MDRRALLRRARTAVDVVRNAVGWTDSPAALARQAKTYWENPPADRRAAFSHWRGFTDDATWRAIGAENFAIFDRFATAAGFDGQCRRIVEWGCGGGANAIHFAPRFDRFVGVEIAQPSLDECRNQLAQLGLGERFEPVKIDAESPAAAIDAIGPASCDAFISFYVFELFPTPEYGAEVMSIARRVLRPGGMAVIQIKYESGVGTRSRRWGYRHGVANMTTYPLAEFWQLAERSGFTPQAIFLTPLQPLVGDERYAHFVMTAR